MVVEGLSDGVHVVILDAVLLAGLFHDGGDAGIVGLDNAREQVVRCLVVESTRECRPEPAASGVVLRRGNLHLCPGGGGKDWLFLNYFHFHKEINKTQEGFNNIPIHMHGVIFICFQPFHLKKERE